MKKTVLIVFIISFFGCSTQKNKTLNKKYRSVISSYNVLFNGDEYLTKGTQDFKDKYEENFWEILPIEPIEKTDKIITVDGLENNEFLKAEEKAAKTIQKHSMLINNVQYNNKINDAYLLLGKARYFDQRYLPAIEAFNQIYNNENENQAWHESVIWKAKTNVRLGQEGSAISLLKELLKKENLSQKTISNAHAALAMAYINLNQDSKALLSLKIAEEKNKDNLLKARYLFIIGQLFESEMKIDSALINYKKIVKFNRKIPREIFINAKVKTLELSNEIDFNSNYEKLISKNENKTFLDKIYFSYSKAFEKNDSIELVKKYLNKAIIENKSDKILKTKVYTKLSEINFDESNFLLAGKYLDSALFLIDKKTKRYWKLDRQKKGIQKVVELEEGIIKWDSLLKISKYNKKKLDSILEPMLISKQNSQYSNFISDSKTNSSFIKTNFYFYNSNIVSLGKESFASIWGKRQRDTYWRSKKSNSIALDKQEQKNSEPQIKESLDFTELYDEIPFSKEDKDSLRGLISLSKIQLGELYILKYNNNKLGRKAINEALSGKIKPQQVTKGKYLLFKSYKSEENKKYEIFKKDILANDSLSIYARILQKSPNQIIGQEQSTNILDSLKKNFENQEFEIVLQEIDQNIEFIDNEDTRVEFEIIRAETLGRLEGINTYNESIKEIYNKYPTSNKSKALRKITAKINRKWKDPSNLANSKSYKAIFVISKKDFSINQINELVKVLEIEILKNRRVSYDVYNYDKGLIVAHDFKSVEDAEETIEKIKESIDDLQLKNNFVSLSSQYKNMLIYKTLELE